MIFYVYVNALIFHVKFKYYSVFALIYVGFLDSLPTLTRHVLSIFFSGRQCRYSFDLLSLPRSESRRAAIVRQYLERVIYKSFNIAFSILYVRRTILLSGLVNALYLSRFKRLNQPAILAYRVQMTHKSVHERA